MAEGFDPGALLARHYVLPRGPRVCLRLARIRDRDGLEALFAGQGISIDELELARLVRSDPREHLLICATALTEAGETIVGAGVIELDGGDREPTVVVVDGSRTEGLGDLLTGALTGRARALTRSRVA